METAQTKRMAGQNVLGGRNRLSLEDVVNDMKNGFYVADSNGNISFANQAFARMLGYADRDEIIGLNMADKLYERKEDRIQFLKRLDEGGYVSDYEIRMVRKDGSRIVISVKSSFVSDKGGAPIGVKGIVEEVPEEKVSKKKKERAVPDLEPEKEAMETDFRGMTHDPLTGLFNYQYFMTSLEFEIKRVECVFHPMSLMIVDIDNFGAFNEKYGREQGDALLKTMAELLKASLRPCDIISRQASDQFLVLLPEIKREEALALAKKLKDTVQTRLSGQKVTCSMGLSRFICGMSPQEYFLQANVGLYMAKEAGKNEACLYG